MPITVGGVEVPVRIVGSSVFGVHPIISSERTYNMFVSDNWLINFAGWRTALELLSSGVEGRGLFHSIRGNFLIVVAGANVYRIDMITGAPSIVGNLGNSTGEVFIDENLASQIGIVATPELWIYNYSTNSFGQPSSITSNTDLIPNYITYQNTHFIIGNGIKTAAGSQWFVYQPTTPVTTGYELTLVSTLTLQTKPDYALAAIRIPGAGNNLLLLGSSVGEIWQDIGGATVYRRNATLNIDYGTVSVSTIAANETMIAWLSINEKSAPSIMYMTGGQAQRISTDGIDKLLAKVLHPEDSTAFFYRQDGHLFYVCTFFNPEDNFTITHDFTTNRNYDLTDWNFNCHPARQVAYFQGRTYFVSLKDGRLYELSSNLNDYTDEEANLVYQIPRVRICDTQRVMKEGMARPEKFIVNLFTFTLENGTEPNVTYVNDCVGYILTEQDDDIIYTEDDLPILVEGGYCGIYKPRIDFTFSKSGGETFSNAVPYYMHKTADYNCQPRFSQLGECNQFTPQLRFWGLWRFVVNNGCLEVRQ
jgi:hypothetical protein